MPDDKIEHQADDDGPEVDEGLQKAHHEADGDTGTSDSDDQANRS
ncbi:MAG TPA: hypothetical protein VGL60_02540 [Acidimicrobiales bacterium]